ncbi:MAG: thioredoxin family protein [Armatimonas sp.]
MVELTHLTFGEFISQNEFAVVHFWADWNPYDKQTQERLEQLPEEIRDRIAIGRLNADVEDHFDIFRAHGVVSLPYLFFYRSSVLIERRGGLMTPEALEEVFRTLL